MAPLSVQLSGVAVTAWHPSMTLCLLQTPTVRDYKASFDAGQIVFCLSFHFQASCENKTKT
jgi:hypothetical protein